MQDSRLIPGVSFKKTFSYAGFEMQRKQYKNPKIALLNIELELKAEKDNAEIRVDTVEVKGHFNIRYNHIIYICVMITKLDLALTLAYSVETLCLRKAV